MQSERKQFAFNSEEKQERLLTMFSNVTNALRKGLFLKLNKLSLSQLGNCQWDISFLC
jgi:hypothetical protein